MNDTAISARTYLLIGLWLAGLMLLGVILSELRILPISARALMWVVLGLSTIKAILVAGYYMHLKMDRRLLLLIALAPFALICLSLSVVLSSFFIKF